MLVEPQPQFRDLSESEVLAALEDPERSAIADEVSRLIDGYTVNFSAHIERRGRLPESFLRAKPRWPIEAVAMRLATEAIQGC